MVTHALSEETDLGEFGTDGQREFRFTPDFGGNGKRDPTDLIHFPFTFGTELGTTSA